MHSERKRLKILFGVPEGEYIARQFAAVAMAMPDAECRFLGFSWYTGRVLRKMGLHYTHVPWKCVRSQEPYVIPPIFEFINRGLRQDTVPASGKCALETLNIFIEREIESFVPDLVVYGPVEHAVCYLMDGSAAARGIPRLGVQTSFVAEHFIVQKQGRCWEDFLQQACVPEHIDGTYPEYRPAVNARRIVKDDRRYRDFWPRSIERSLRVLCGGTSFDTVPILLAAAAAKFALKKWLPNTATLEADEDMPSGCVLVALHQPSLSWTNPTWVDLIKFALEATPEGVPIVIRPHPHEKPRQIPWELENALSCRGARVSRAFNGPDLTTLLKRCRTMLTLTSAVGMEALLAGVPVFTLGPSFYARPGLARAVTLKDAAMVREMILHPEHYLPDAAKVAQFAAWLMSEHMVKAPEFGGVEKNSLPARIRAILRSEGQSVT